MKILVISDTHNNQLILRKVLENEQDLAYIFHLGDNYEDLDDHPDLLENVKVIKVPGIFHRGYLNGNLEKIRTVQIGNWNFLLVHNIEDISNTKADIILFGHTHDRLFMRKRSHYFINPGHLKDHQHKQRDASYVILQFEDKEISVIFKKIDASVIEQFKIKK